jgi:hypothetical protein
VSEPDGRTVEMILARLSAEPAPTAPGPFRRVGEQVATLRGQLRHRWRMAVVALVAALAVLLAVTPAGAKVREWLGFGAVLVEQSQPVPDSASGVTATTTAPGVTAGDREMSLEQARAAVTFPIGVPAALGEPDRVTVSSDGRVATMVWPDTPSGTVRLDQIDGALSPYFVKKYYQDVVFTVVDGAEGLWLPETHPITVLNPDGSERAASTRQSGPSLVWQRGDVTLRLEGVADRQAAVTIAESLPH